MEKIIVIAVGLYILFESFTAINEMGKVDIKNIISDFFDPYGLKYLCLGLYAIALLYFAESSEALK